MAMMVKVGDFLNYFFLMIEYNDNDGHLTSVVLTFFAIIFKKDASLICFTDSMVTLLPTMLQCYRQFSVNFTRNIYNKKKIMPFLVTVFVAKFSFIIILSFYKEI